MEYIKLFYTLESESKLGIIIPFEVFELDIFLLFIYNYLIYLNIIKY